MENVNRLVPTTISNLIHKIFPHFTAEVNGKFELIHNWFGHRTLAKNPNDTKHKISDPFVETPARTRTRSLATTRQNRRSKTNHWSETHSTGARAVVSEEHQHRSTFRVLVWISFTILSAVRLYAVNFRHCDAYIVIRAQHLSLNTHSDEKKNADATCRKQWINVLHWSVTWN